jgi:hypothetical protein
MPRPKGPEKVFFKVGVTLPTHARLLRKAAGKAIGAYVAERLEQETFNAAKNAKVPASAEPMREFGAAAGGKCKHPRQPPYRHGLWCVWSGEREVNFLRSIFKHRHRPDEWRRGDRGLAWYCKCGELWPDPPHPVGPRGPVGS